MNIKKFLPVIELNVKTNKAILNQKARILFKDLEDKVGTLIKSLDLSKSLEYIYIANKLYMIENIVLIFHKIDDTSMFCPEFKKEKDELVLLPRYMLNRFLDKFLALKKRYGGFHIKFLYLKIDFILKINEDLKQKFIKDITQYLLSVTRNSDVVGLIEQNVFGLILTNPSLTGGNIIANKIIKYINDFNLKQGMKVMEAYGVLGHELFILKQTDFDEFLDTLEKNAVVIQQHKQVKELIKT
jgi:GGDEF domain-containing protein